MGPTGTEFLEQLKNIGDKLLHPPSSNLDLLILLDEVHSFLSKIGQAPSKAIQETLVPTMEALISEKLMKHCEGDIVVTVASCLNEVMRVSAPIAPYDDNVMRQIFELIVSCFDYLSYPHDHRCYTKSVLILESVARLKSCVMMLDLDCDFLLVNMFRLFLKHISSNHPRAVFLAMEKIMTVVIKESDSLSQDLIDVLLESITIQNQIASPTSFDLGVKVVEECSEKLKEYIVQAVASRGFCLNDYAPILSTIYGNGDKDHPHDSSNNPPLKVLERCSENGGADLETDLETGKRKPSLASSHGLIKRSKKALLTNEDETKEAIDFDNNKVFQSTPLGGVSDKKAKPNKKDLLGGFAKKSATGLSRKDRIQSNEKTRSASDDDVIETPHGKKSYKEDLIGCRIKVWWPLDRRYYEGTISSFDASNKKHKVDYDDGDQEVLNLQKEQWEFVGEEISDIDFFVNKKAPLARSNTSKREEAMVFEKGEVKADSGAKIVDSP